MCGPEERAASIAATRQVRSAAERLIAECGRICFVMGGTGSALRDLYQRTVEEGVPADMQRMLDRLGFNEGVDDGSEDADIQGD